ncbi:MAG: DNA-processing protein DprA, partial [Chloroflexota bacterium]
YPSRLVNQLDRDAPPMLYVKGNTDLLNVPGIGFSGSRKASEAGLAHTTQLVQQSVERGMMVISGHAGGVDAVAHKAAVDAGGQTALAIPEGILKFQMRAELREAYDESPELFVVVSEFLPGIPWSGRNAMARNRIILGMSDVTCIIEAGTSGGTWNAGVTALKLNIPSFVLQYDNPPDSAEGNIRLIERGAIPIPADETGIQLPGIMPTVDKPIQPGLFDHDTNND